jgi:L-cysteine S-thiosulfotransferase
MQRGETRLPGATLALALLAMLVSGLAVRAQDAGDAGKHSAGDKKSGYLFAEPETRAMMDDDFNNPGFLWVDKGAALWSKAEGIAGKSCASCHGDAKTTMKGVGARYPLYDAKSGKLVDIEERINLCRSEHMQAPALAWESEELLAMTAYVKLQSRGMPVAVAVDGPAMPFFERGKAFYESRRGQLDMSCSQCHVDNLGRKLRSETLSQGQSNGFPTYRLSWQKLGSIQRRFRECNSQIRAEPLPFGAEDYVALELYVAWRGQGLPIESPSVRK